MHPMSGAGSIKFDGSDEETLYEVKDAPTQYTLKSDELKSLWKQAMRQGKDPVFIIQFETGMRAVIEVEKE